MVTYKQFTKSLGIMAVIGLSNAVRAGADELSMLGESEVSRFIVEPDEINEAEDIGEICDGEGFFCCPANPKIYCTPRGEDGDSCEEGTGLCWIYMYPTFGGSTWSRYRASTLKPCPKSNVALRVTRINIQNYKLKSTEFRGCHYEYEIAPGKVITIEFNDQLPPVQTKGKIY